MSKPFAQGRKKYIWHGRYCGRGCESIRFSPNAFVQQYEALSLAMAELARLWRFLVAPLDCGMRLRQRAEAAIAGHLYAQEGPVGTFQDKGIR